MCNRSKTVVGYDERHKNYLTREGSMKIKEASEEYIEKTKNLTKE